MISFLLLQERSPLYQHKTYYNHNVLLSSPTSANNFKVRFIIAMIIIEININYENKVDQ